MYKCMDCGLVFDEPMERREKVHTQVEPEIYVEYVCPDCLNTEIAEADLCPECGSAKYKDEILCRDCREDLLDRVKAFFDGFTAEEEEQFDEWMDGRSITDRREWA